MFHLALRFTFLYHTRMDRLHYCATSNRRFLSVLVGICVPDNYNFDVCDMLNGRGIRECVFEATVGIRVGFYALALGRHVSVNYLDIFTKAFDLLNSFKPATFSGKF